MNLVSVNQCKCRLNKNVCNSKRKWNRDECRFECKEFVDWSSRKDDYIGNPSKCSCEYDRACKPGEYLDIKNCSCKNVFSIHQFYHLKMRY